MSGTECLTYCQGYIYQILRCAQDDIYNKFLSLSSLAPRPSSLTPTFHGVFSLPGGVGGVVAGEAEG